MLLDGLGSNQFMICKYGDKNTASHILKTIAGTHGRTTLSELALLGSVFQVVSGMSKPQREMWFGATVGTVTIASWFSELRSTQSDPGCVPNSLYSTCSL